MDSNNKNCKTFNNYADAVNHHANSDDDGTKLTARMIQEKKIVIKNKSILTRAIEWIEWFVC